MLFDIWVFTSGNKSFFNSYFFNYDFKSKKGFYILCCDEILGLLSKVSLFYTVSTVFIAFGIAAAAAESIILIFLLSFSGSLRLEILKAGNLVNYSVNMFSYFWLSFFLALGTESLKPKSRMIFLMSPLGLSWAGNRFLPPGLGDRNWIGDFDFYSEALRLPEL